MAIDNITEETIKKMIGKTFQRDYLNRIFGEPVIPLSTTPAYRFMEYAIQTAIQDDGSFKVVDYWTSERRGERREG